MIEDVWPAYNYDALLLRPRKSSIASRQDVDLSTEILPGIKLKIPIIAAPMDTVCEAKMCTKMYELGGLGILHRFADIGYLRRQMKELSVEVPVDRRAFAIGINEEDHEDRPGYKTILEVLAEYAGIVCLDVNIGHHDQTMKVIHYVRDKYPWLKVIAGNVSTGDGARDLINAGAQCIRATNGGGSACTTLNVTGVGIPTATSLKECVERLESAPHGTVISDGSHKASSSMVVALALGAGAVMIGGLLAGSSCVPEHVFYTDEKGYRRAKYFGMASKEAQHGKLKRGTAPEGISMSSPVRGKTRDIIEELAGGIRSGMSLCNCRNLSQLQAYGRHPENWVRCK